MATSVLSETIRSEAEPSHDGPFLRFGWRLPTMTIRDVIERHGHFAHGGNPDLEAEEARDLLGVT
jgi:hypothetical protein